MKRFIFIFLILCGFLAASKVYASVIINEICWMGTITSVNDEWIELYNNTQGPVNLDGWQLIAQDGTPKINLSGTTPAMGFYLLERTNDETVPEIPADLIYKGALGNNGEYLKLYDNSGNLVDEVNCSDGWPAGDNKTKQTMERTDSGWQTSQNPGGTPKAKNSPGTVETKPPQPPDEITEIGSPAAESVSYPKGVVLNEILPSPEGPDAENEWIELYNQNNFEVDLSNWKIKDNEGKTTTYAFPVGSKIPPLGYLFLKRPETKITLNNTGDGLELIQPNGEIADSVTFGKAITGQSYNREEDNWYWSATQTPGAKNEEQKRAEDIPLPAESLAEKETAAIGEKITNPSKGSLSTGLIAFAIAIFSAIVILILKKILTPKSPISS